MAYNALNNLIDAYIYANGVQAITGQILNGVLKQMVSQLGSGYHLMGVAGPETVPASNDYAMAYFAATAGEYTGFGGITLAPGEVAVLLTSGNGSWSKQTIYNVPTTTEDLENTANFITNAVTDLVNYYTKTEVDDTLANYPTLQGLATALADYYTKTEVDAELADRYTKQETDTKLDGYYPKAETYDKDEVDSIVAALSRQEYIVAWDGSSAPVVADIPAGVTVTYSGTPYTGTLAASASTVNKIYMVWNGVAYDMYATSQDGGYSWVPMGSTSVDLTQYVTTADLDAIIAPLNDEVFASSTTIYDSTAPNDTYYEQPFLVNRGDECTISLKAETSFNAVISASTANDTVVESLLNGSITGGQTITKTFVATSTVYKIKIAFLTRGILQVFTTNQSLRRMIDKNEKEINGRLSPIEEIIRGVDAYDLKDESTWDMNNGNLEINTIHGSAYSLVKFKIDNQSDVSVRANLFYRNTHLRSVLLGSYVFRDKSSDEVILEIPEDFVSVLYQPPSYNLRTVDTITVLNPKQIDNISEDAISSNVLDLNTLTPDVVIKPDGTTSSDWNYAVTDYIKVKEGDIVIASSDANILQQPGNVFLTDPRPLYMRAIAVYDYNKNILPTLGPDYSVNHQTFIVPKGAYYIRVSMRKEYLNETNARINLGGIILPYEPYWVGARPTGVNENKQEIEKAINFPLTVLPEYIVNTLANKPLGSFSKGYICVTDDDGSIGLGTYTLPMVTEKQVPVTFFLMKDSVIFQAGNEQYKNALLSAVSNGDCSIGQHGGINWTEYNEKQLYEFFNTEKGFWDSLGVTVGSSACPSGFTTRTIEAVAGGYFGVHRSVYEGYNGDNTPNYHAIHTDYYACTPRTSIYCLPAVNVRSYSLEQWQGIIDWVVANKLLLVVYFHDFDFVETAEDYQNRRIVLEGFLDYAKAHATMVKAEDIPGLY